MRKRADLVLVERGFFQSRARAQAAIAAGLVSVGGVALAKPSEEVADDARDRGLPPRTPGSRAAGVKLAAALDAFGLDPAGLACLDVGASTGGFTDVLLARGAAQVTAVDVGHGQFDPRLAADPRVRSLEGFDARALTLDAYSASAPARSSCDVSFISQRLVLPHVLKLAARAGVAGQPCQAAVRARPGRHRERAGQERSGARASVRGCARRIESQGWTVLGLIPSPVLGGGGAREFLIGARNG